MSTCQVIIGEKNHDPINGAIELSGCCLDERIDNVFGLLEKYGWRKNAIVDELSLCEDPLCIVDSDPNKRAESGDQLKVVGTNCSKVSCEWFFCPRRDESRIEGCDIVEPDWRNPVTRTHLMENDGQINKTAVRDRDDRARTLQCIRMIRVELLIVSSGWRWNSDELVLLHDSDVKCSPDRTNIHTRDTSFSIKESIKQGRSPRSSVACCSIFFAIFVNDEKQQRIVMYAMFEESSSQSIVANKGHKTKINCQLI